MVKVCELRQRAVAGLRGDAIGVSGRGLEVDLGRIGDGDDAGHGIDGEAAARAIAGQAVGHRGSVDIGRECGDTDGRTIRGAFRNGVGGAIIVDGGGRRDIGHADGKRLRTGGQAGGGLYGDAIGVSRRALEVDLGGVGDGDDAGHGIDGEAAERRVGGQRIGRGRPVRVGGEGGDADRRAVGGALDHGVRGVVGVDRCRDRSVRDRDGEGLRTRQREVAGLRGDGVAAAGAFEIDLGGIGDGDDAGRGVDGKAAAGSVAGQRIGHAPVR